MEAWGVVVVGICLFAFALVLLLLGEIMGGNWQLIAQGVTKFIIVIVAFVMGAFVVVSLARRR